MVVVTSTKPKEFSQSCEHESCSDEQLENTASLCIWIFLVLQLTVCHTRAYTLLLRSLSFFLQLTGLLLPLLYRDPSGENYFFFFASLLLISVLINQ